MPSCQPMGPCVTCPGDPCIVCCKPSNDPNNYAEASSASQGGDIEIESEMSSEYGMGYNDNMGEGRRDHRRNRRNRRNRRDRNYDY
jgi:hypothetical protein